MTHGNGLTADQAGSLATEIRTAVDELNTKILYARKNGLTIIIEAATRQAAEKPLTLVAIRYQVKIDL